MQDIRLRAGTAIILSLAAFASIPGAVLVFLWWLCFANPVLALRKMRMTVPAILLVLFFGIVLELTGGGGFSYSFRMVALVLIGAWLYAGYCRGDLLKLGTGLLGNRIGFDLGLIAEMGLQSLELMLSDLTRIRHAQELKGTCWGVRSMVPAGTVLVRNALRRADETAEILAVRGYSEGGSYCPVFSSSVRDIIAGIAALCIPVIACVPVSEFFILIH